MGADLRDRQASQAKLGVHQELCKAGVQSQYKGMPSPGRQASGMAGARYPDDLPKGYHTAVPRAELYEPGRRLHRGLPPSRRAVGQRHCRRDATRSPVRFPSSVLRHAAKSPDLHHQRGRDPST